jgi:hypothetical protein
MIVIDHHVTVSAIDARHASFASRSDLFHHLRKA